MMGYASFGQISTGIHDRQWARAFIVRDLTPPHRRVVHVVVDNGQVFQSIAEGVHDKVRADPELSPYYSYENIVLTATHTHGGAGGHSKFALYSITIGGFVWQTYDAIVHGIYMAIKKAHRDLKPGTVRWNRGALLDANQNRAAGAFLQNVEHQYAALGNPFGAGDRDTEMFALRFDHDTGGPAALFTWFATHPVSVSKENTLLTGDNKGNASYLMEKDLGAIYPGYPGYDSNQSTFVAGFATSNPGDMTANRRDLEAPWPEPGTEEGGDYRRDIDFGRAETIGSRLHLKAKDLYLGSSSALNPISGGVDYRHAFVNMNDVPVDLAATYPYDIPGVAFPGTPPASPNTCRGSIGAELLAGTRDGEGMPDWLVTALQAAGYLIDSDPALNTCQLPKSIMAATAGTDSPGMTGHWMPISILKVGDVVILSVPAEFTVTAGWRLRKTVERAFAEHGVTVQTIVSGLANAYSGYVTTYEEYQHQGVPPETLVAGQTYEGSSTHFGPFTLAAYQKKFRELAVAMATGASQPVAPATVVMPPQVKTPEFVVPALQYPFLSNPNPLKQVAAVYHEPSGCPEGQFFDLGTGACWSCPAGD